jgi:hypothetical protein
VRDYIEKDTESLEFVTFIFEVEDKDKIPSRIAISSVSFVVGGAMYKKDADESGDTMTIEEGVEACAMEIIDSIEKDFTILKVH